MSKDIVNKEKDKAKEISKNFLNDRDGRIASYQMRGVNKTKNRQRVRDFTSEKEKELCKWANKVNGEHEILNDLPIRWFWDVFSSTIIGKLLDMIHHSEIAICEVYNYLGSIIKTIFRQARECDEKYSNKINGNPKSIAEDNVFLLKNLNEAFNYYSRNKDRGCTIINALSNATGNNDYIDHLNDLEVSNQVKRIKSFTENKENVNVFNKYSNKIYRDLKIDSKEFLTFISNNEEIINKLVQKLLDKIMVNFGDKSINMFLNEILDDNAAVVLIKKLIDSTGVMEYSEGYLRIYILRQVKAAINKKYIDLFNKINSGKSDDYSRLKYLYEQLKDLEKTIVTTYRDMNLNNPNKQVESNGWLNELKDEDCGEIVA